MSRSLITDVAGLAVGHAEDLWAMTGVTVLVPDAPVTCAVDVRGGGPGTRETDALGLDSTVDEAHAIVLSGGSAFGLEAAGAVQTWLAARGRGFAVGTARVPIVPQAILFDLLNGGSRSFDDPQPYARLARAAAEHAGRTFPLGSVGAGYGATTATLRGGLGSASEELDGGIVVGALAAANPVGSVTIGASPHFWAAPFEVAQELGGLGLPPAIAPADLVPRLKGVRAGQATTLAIVATNAALSKRACRRLAIMAQTGLARAIYPVHTPLDGDTVFALSTGSGARVDDAHRLALIGTAAANCLARAVARGIYEAAPAPAGWTGPPAYRTRFPEAR